MRSGTSKGSTISQYGCSTFGALATEAQYKEEEEPVSWPLFRMLYETAVTQTCVLLEAVVL